MDKSRMEQYHSLFERMIRCMTDRENFDRNEFVQILKDLSILFRLSKGVTEFYRSESAEKSGDGEIMIDYDTGKKDHPVIQKRILSKSKSVIISTLYMADEEPPLEKDELNKLDLILSALVSFIARNRFETSTEMLGYYDDDNYPNLRFFKRYLETLISGHNISGKTMLCFNLRNFSGINQDIGRDGGDIALRNYFETLKSAAGDDGMICRIGGDNFAMAFSREYTDEILHILSGFPVIYDPNGKNRVLISASAGIYDIPDDNPPTNPGEVIGAIYTALLTAKHNPETPFIYYDQKMIATREKAAQVQLLFPKALENNEFRVFYQPKVDIESGRIMGAEALCRWFRDGQMIPPGEFIPVLEQSPDICRLDFHILDLVCRDIRRWLDAEMPVVRVSVNLSRKHLADVDLQKHILDIIDSHRIPHQYIEIELTETATEVGFRALKRVAGELQDNGFCISVDDFGMGYSSLNLIREIPWNVLKIDRCFLPTDSDDENSSTSLMYGHVISMALDLGLECVTEGVETPKQVEILKKNNCRFAQGFYFDKPLSVEEFEDRISRGYYRIDTKNDRIFK